VVGLNELSDTARSMKPTCVISLLDAHRQINLDLDIQFRHLLEHFDDTESEFSPHGPKRQQIERILEFSRSITPHDRMIVHCHAGLSRSTATALAIFVQHGMDEFSALRSLLKLRPAATPNLLVLYHVDQIMGSNLQGIVAGWLEISLNWWFESYRIQNAGTPSERLQFNEKQLLKLEKFRQKHQSGS
jgi:predicted protein tyrosine phosphatase